MFNQSRLKFKVKFQGKTLYDCISFRLISSYEPILGLTNNAAYMYISSMMSQCAMRMFDQGRFKFKVKHCIAVFPFYIF